MTAVQDRPAPAEIKEEQPYVDPTPNRRTGMWLGIIALVWVVGWAVFKGQSTLATGFQDQTAFHKWLNDLRDNIQLAAARGNWFFDGVIGGISDALNWVTTHLQELVSVAAFPRPVPEIGWLGVVAILVWLAFAVAGWKSVGDGGHHRLGLRRSSATGKTAWTR